MAFKYFLVGVFVFLLMLNEGKTACTKNVTTDSQRSSNTGLEWMTYNQYTFPNPKMDIIMCGHNKIGHVCDPGQALTTDQYDDITRITQKFQNIRHECSSIWECKGYEAAVAVVPKIADTVRGRSSEEKAKTFVNYLRKKGWYSSYDHNNVVILVSLMDKVVYTSTGSETMKKLTNKCVQKVSDEYKCLIAEDTIAQLLEGMLTRYFKILLGQYGSCGEMLWWHILLIALACGFASGFVLCLCVWCCCGREKVKGDREYTSQGYTNRVYGGWSGGDE